MSALKPEGSVVAGVATAALVYGVFSAALPSIAEVRASDAGDLDLATAEQSATFLAASAVAAVSLLTKDPTIFALGGSMVVALAWWHRHANMVDPMTGKVARGGSVEPYPDAA